MAPALSQTLTLTRLTPSAEPAFLELLALYEQSFPVSERKPVPTLRRMLLNPHSHFLLAVENGHTVGFAIVQAFTDHSAAMVEYMAIAPAHRGRGLGGQLFLAIAQAIPHTLLMEVESDRTDTPEQSLRTRRKNFYRAFGAREISTLSWIMPPVISTPPPPMELLVFPATTPTIPRPQLHQWLRAIYVEVYEQSPTDPRIDTMLSPLPAEIPLI